MNQLVHDWGPTIVGLVVAVYTYGRLTERVTTNRNDIADVRGTLVKHGDKLEEHGEAIASLQARPRYVNGSSH